MTYVKELAYKDFPSGIVVIARSVETSNTLEPCYEVLRYHGRKGYTERFSCAKTTWQKKFREICAEEGR